MLLSLGRTLGGSPATSPASLYSALFSFMLKLPRACSSRGTVHASVAAARTPLQSIERFDFLAVLMLSAGQELLLDVLL